MNRGRRAIGRGAAALGILLSLLIAVPDTAIAWESNRHTRCTNRADNYAADDHPNLTPQEIQERTDWLYSQCAENDAVEAFAEEQGSMAPELFPNTENDRHAHPLHCMSLKDDRFGMHNNHDSTNPPPDPNGPGGAAAANVPGDFMYAFIDGKARFMTRYVIWTVDDINGDPITPVKVNQHPTYMGTPQVTVAILNFSQAYQPVSIWVEMPDNMAVANQENSGLLPGRRLTMRTWMESKCHDKRDPTVIPHMLIDHMENLGWLDENATPESPRAVRFVANGNPNQASSWSLTEVPIQLPAANDINSKGQFRWFHDSDVVYNGEDNLGPSLTIDHSPGDTFLGPVVPLSGDASDTTAVDSVKVTIENSAGQYLQNDGSFGSNPTQLDTTLGSPGAGSTSWSIDVTLPDDSYDLEVIGEDTLGNTSVLSNADFIVNPSGPDIEAPIVDMDHERDTQFVGPTVTITGTSSDNIGVTSVDVEIKDRVTKEFLQPDGSFGPRVQLPATLANPGATSSTWSITVTLPAAGYNIQSFAYDAAGNVGENPTWKKFDVVDGPSDNIDPDVFADHSPGTEFTANPVNLSGTATDNVGVTSVVVTIENSAGQYLQNNGSFAASVAELATTLGSPGGSPTSWAISVTLPDDSYDLDVFARDGAGNEGSELAADFTVNAPDVIDPTVTTDHNDGAQFTAPNVSLAGTAADNVGVAAVVATIVDGAGDYLQGDGSFAATPFELAATLDSPGATASDWQLDVTLPVGSYDLEVIARDAVGNEGTAPNADFDVTAVPDFIPPTVNVSHAKDTEFTGPDLTITGVAADNFGVTSVVVKVKDRDTGLWLQSDGSFSAGVVWHDATMDNPGATDVMWSIDLTLPNGRYNPVGRAFDAAGNQGTQTAFRPFEVVGDVTDTQDPTTNVDHAKNEVFGGPAVTLTGFADDNVGVVAVRVKIKDRDTGQWLQADGSFASPVHWHEAAIDNPGATHVTWSIQFDLPDGSYNPVSRAFDAAGNEGTQTAFRPIQVV